MGSKRDRQFYFKQPHNSYIIGKLSIRRVNICIFSRIGRKTEEKELLKVQKMTARRVYMVTVLWTGSDRFGQVWTSQNRCEVLFFLNCESHAVQIWPNAQTCVQISNRISFKTLQPSEVVGTVLRHASISVRCELV